MKIKLNFDFFYRPARLGSDDIFPNNNMAHVMFCPLEYKRKRKVILKNETKKRQILSYKNPQNIQITE
jgi:hypothetical protein